MEIFISMRKALQDLADSSRAPQMQKYMKSEIPFYGIPTPVRRRICRNTFKGFAPWDFKKWNDTVLEIWKAAEFREEKYSAIELVNWKPCHAFHNLQSLPMLEEIIVSGAWWDYCDNLAGALGNILRNDPKEMRRLMLEWSEGENLWKRRSAILCQLRFKDKLDFEFLTKCIEPNISSKEFFLRKGIGWALRDYAWTNPHQVKEYVEKNDGRLSGLSKREAMKNMHKLI